MHPYLNVFAAIERSRRTANFHEIRSDSMIATAKNKDSGKPSQGRLCTLGLALRLQIRRATRRSRRHPTPDEEV